MISEIQMKIEEAKLLSLQKNYTESLKVYSELESSISQVDDFNSAKILSGIGNIYRAELQFSKAIKYFHKALDFNPHNKLALKGIANSYRGIKDRQLELTWWLKYIEVDKKDFLALTRIADAYRNLGNLAKSEEYYLMTLKQQSTNKFALMGLGDLYYKCKNYNQALIYWEQLLELYPDFINILTMVGNIYRLRRDFKMAMEYYQRAYKIAPTNNYVLYGIADTLRGTKYYKDSIPFWIALSDKNGKTSRIVTRLGDAYYMEKDYDNAYTQYNYAWNEYQDKYGYVGLIRLKIQNSDYDGAHEMILELLTKFGSDTRIAILSIELLADIGKTSEIISIISKYYDIKSNRELSEYLSDSDLI